METELMGVVEVARRLGMSKFTLYYWVSAGRIPHYKLGRNVRFDWTEVQRWLEKQRREVA